MSFKYTAKITRNSLDDLFFFELNRNSQLMPFVNIEALGLRGCLGIELGNDSLISWEDLWDRRDGLRPDHRDSLEYEHQYILDFPELWGTGPDFNPFSLSRTIIANFATLEDLKHGYDILVSDKTVEDVIATNNIYEETFIDADGNEFILDESKFKK